MLLLTFIVSANAQINRGDWQMNPGKARNQTTLNGIPANALHTSISITNFKQKLSLQKQEITLPNPDGQFETFVIEPTKVVAQEVAHLYTIKTFRGYKKDDPTVLLSADISDNGFHAGVFTAQHSYFIEPISTQPNQANELAIYYKRDVKGKKLKCQVEHATKRQAFPTSTQKRSKAVAKRTFRLAVVASGEYGQQFGGSPYSATIALNAMASGVNMMNVVYLRDVGIEFTLVSNASMVFGNPGTDNIDIDDGDANTENDQIQADSCSCTGTMVDACAAKGGDADNDGVCADDDCDDNDPNIGAKRAVGTTCDDGDANTEIDQIQADSCSCMVTPIP
ncbi:MAG: reprolysin-like metallopeptidase [Bacteroidota bacterium]